MTARGEPVGTFCLVLHSHLPWLARHGGWPVGEEWLYQAWAHSYLPLLRMLDELAAQGRTDVLTLGVTPVLAAQLDDPYTLRGCHDWLGTWSLRAQYAATRWQHGDHRLRELAAAEYRAAQTSLRDFEGRWQHGFSPLLRSLVDNQVVELLGGPATHPFGPLLAEPLRSFALRTGLADTRLRIGHAPAGIWAPECGYAPGMEQQYAAAGVQRFLVDGPALHGDTATARTVGGTDVVCFGRDLPVTYRVWSPKAGYPGDAAYRDFHTFDHPSGLKPARVTGKRIAPEHKQPYQPDLATTAVARHAADFVDTVVRRCKELGDAVQGPPLVVAAYDTELFGHWWHEGPQWLAAVLRLLPEAGVRVSTLRGALQAGHLGAPVELPASSWGSGKDWRVWDGAQVADLTETNAALQQRVLDTLLPHLRPAAARDPVADQVLREALLALSSDWAFMVTKDSAADYARHRAGTHTARCHELLDALGTPRAAALAAELRGQDGVFGQLDARDLLGSSTGQ